MSEEHDTVEAGTADDDLRPVPARRAFLDDSPSAIASQAVFLLSVTAAVGGHHDAVPIEPALPLPRNLRALERGGGVFGPRRAIEELINTTDVSEDELYESQPSIRPSRLAPLVDVLMNEPTPEAATSLVEGCLRSPHLVVRSAAAASALDTVGARDDVLGLLREGARSDDDLIGPVARAGLSRARPDDPVLQRRTRPESDIDPKDHESNTSVITHGTFPSNSGWWQPGNGGLYDYLALAQPQLDLHTSSFDWTGDWNEPARRAAAFNLDDWITSEGIGVSNLDFFGHSHGGTIAHLATALRKRRFRRLVLMSWPHRCQWRPDFDHVGKILDIRVKADLAILAERARQSFQVGGADQAKITTIKKGWFKHSDPRRKSYWQKHDLLTKLDNWW